MLEEVGCCLVFPVIMEGSTGKKPCCYLYFVHV